MSHLGKRIATVHLAPVALAAEDFAPLRVAGAWSVTSDDPRFGGVSALAVAGGRLLALTDAGVLIGFDQPRGRGGSGRASLIELPAGPGGSGYKLDRDSEALLRNPRGRGWWVGFENWNQLWLYDDRFERALRRIDFGVSRWPENVGIEGLASSGSAVLIFPERGRSVVRLIGTRAIERPIARPRGRIADAVRLPTGALVVLHRGRSWRGLVNRLTWLGETPGGGFRPLRSIALGRPGRDNFEALAAQSLPGGAIRLWVMTDDNFQPPMRTLLVALDLPPNATR